MLASTQMQNITENDFKEKSLNDKWQLYKNLLSENYYLKTELSKMALIHSALVV
ncbi:MAG: hypothetical protein Gaeavirus39_1, partial [Gaeavirus sp.]